MTRIYLASRYSRRAELCGYRDQLQALGYTVTSRWLNGSHQIGSDGTPLTEDGEALVEFGDPALAKELRQAFAWEDLIDVAGSDQLIAFTEEPYQTASRGGRWFEMGYAYARGLSLTIVGPRENLFCWLPVVRQFDTWEEAVAFFRQR